MNYPKLIEQNFWNVIIVRNNPYGYRLNLNHYIVREFYWRYKEKKGIPRTNIKFIMIHTIHGILVLV